jgi:hypothetical protein
MCWFRAIPMRYAQRLVFAAAVYIHGFSLCRSRLLFTILPSRAFAFSGPMGA